MRMIVLLLQQKGLKAIFKEIYGDKRIGVVSEGNENAEPSLTLTAKRDPSKSMKKWITGCTCPVNAATAVRIKWHQP